MFQIIDHLQTTLTVHFFAKPIFILDDLRTKHETHYEKFEKDGDIYMRATKYIVKFLPDHVTLQFDNLFNGDSILGIKSYLINISVT